MKNWIVAAAVILAAGCASQSPVMQPMKVPPTSPPPMAQAGQTASPGGTFEVLLHSEDLRHLWVTRSVEVVKQDEDGDPVSKTAHVLMACRVARNEERPTCHVADIIGPLEDLVWPDDVRRYHLPGTPLGAIVPQPEDEGDAASEPAPDTEQKQRPSAADDSGSQDCYYDNRHGTVCPDDPEYRRSEKKEAPASVW